MCWQPSRVRTGSEWRGVRRRQQGGVDVQDAPFKLRDDREQLDVAAERDEVAAELLDPRPDRRSVGQVTGFDAVIERALQAERVVAIAGDASNGRV